MCCTQTSLPRLAARDVVHRHVHAVGHRQRPRGLGEVREVRARRAGILREVLHVLGLLLVRRGAGARRLQHAHRLVVVDLEKHGEKVSGARTPLNTFSD